MNKKSIILIVDSPVLNPANVEPLQNLSIEYSIYLNSLLISNWLEILDVSLDNCELTILLNEFDKEFIPKNFIPQNVQTFLYTDTKLKSLPEDIIKQKSAVNSKTLILFYNSIGLKKSEIERIFNLAHPEENTFILAKSTQNKIILVCSYNPDKLILDSLFLSDRDYQKYLNLISSKDIFIHTFEGYLSVDNFEDIKKLYIELSKKESLSYCSQKIHESFNDLFVEYKEILNE